MLLSSECRRIKRSKKVDQSIWRPFACRRHMANEYLQPSFTPTCTHASLASRSSLVPDRLHNSTNHRIVFETYQVPSLSQNMISSTSSRKSFSKQKPLPFSCSKDPSAESERNTVSWRNMRTRKKTFRKSSIACLLHVLPAQTCQPVPVSLAICLLSHQQRRDKILIRRHIPFCPVRHFLTRQALK